MISWEPGHRPHCRWGRKPRRELRWPGPSRGVPRCGRRPSCRRCLTIFTILVFHSSPLSGSDDDGGADELLGQESCRRFSGRRLPTTRRGASSVSTRGGRRRVGEPRPAQWRYASGRAAAGAAWRHAVRRSGRDIWRKSSLRLACSRTTSPVLILQWASLLRSALVAFLTSSWAAASSFRASRASASNCVDVLKKLGDGNVVEVDLGRLVARPHFPRLGEFLARSRPPGREFPVVPPSTRRIASGRALR